MKATLVRTEDFRKVFRGYEKFGPIQEEMYRGNAEGIIIIEGLKLPDYRELLDKELVYNTSPVLAFRRQADLQAVKSIGEPVGLEFLEGFMKCLIGENLAARRLHATDRRRHLRVYSIAERLMTLAHEETDWWTYINPLDILGRKKPDYHAGAKNHLEELRAAGFSIAT
ncbi:MAG: hypothetical protein HYX24_06975 [Candidatus Aenigmarchaeota archaeon]|nr:hypothetical protein [Candidatus Aenigmarchaeota archaeon]